MEGNEICVDRAKPEDLPDMLRLLESLFSLEADFSFDATRQRRGLEMLLRQGERVAVLVARAPDQQVVGMVTVQLVISTAEGSYSAWLEDVVVQNSWQGMGIGRSLVESALDWARERGARRAQLLADQDNGSALGFYARLGWRPSNMNMLRMMIEPGSQE